MISASELDTAFPDVECGIRPLGPRVLVQLRLVKKRTASGIHIVQETRDYNQQIAQFGKVRALGPLAFKDRSTAKDWPEGAWCALGDIVRCPKYGGDRFAVDTKDGDSVVFVIFDDSLIDAILDPKTFVAVDELV